MTCKYCGQYYPNKEKRCPWCGNSMSRNERKDSDRLSEEQSREITHEDELRGWEAFGAVNPNHPLARRQPVKVVLVGTHDDYRTRSGLGRAIVGGALLGELGAFIGAITSERKSSVTKQMATFAVKYASGKTGTETVKIGSERYLELIKYIVE